MEDFFKEFFNLDRKIRNEESKSSELINVKNLKKLKQQKNKFSRLAFDQIKNNYRFKSRQVLPCTDTFNIKNKRNKVKLIIQYYDEKNANRRDELVRSIRNNVFNKIIDKIFLYVEFSDTSRSVNEMLEDFGELDKSKLEIIPTTRRLTYLEAIVKSKQDKDDDTVYILCNNDCYFDATVGLLKKIDFKDGNLICCMTRKDLTKNGDVVDAIEPGVSSDGYILERELTIKREDCKLLDLSSQDAWAFTNQLKVDFDATTEIGTFNCEYMFTSQAYLSGKILRSIGEYVKCIHIHNTNLRKEYALKNQKTISTVNNMYPSNENPRTLYNYINGCWRLRTKENYIDKDSTIHEYSDFFVDDFRKLL